METAEGQNQSPSLQRREEKKESRRAAKAEGRDEQVRRLGTTFCLYSLSNILQKYIKYESLSQVRDVKEEAEGEDAVSSSSQLARFPSLSLFAFFHLLLGKTSMKKNVFFRALPECRGGSTPARIF